MFVSNRKIRVLIAGIDNDHSRRTDELAGFLRDAGMDIIDSRCESPETIAAAAVRDDVDAVGMSVNGVHNTVCQQIVALLRAKSVDDCLVVVCDTVPEDEAQNLEEQGISKAFPLGAPPSAVVDYLQAHVRPPWSLPFTPAIM
jgi:methylmalonyl-CoA mutase cobalamin-binding domain/chain